MPFKDPEAKRRYEQQRWARTKVDKAYREKVLARARANWARRFAEDPDKHNDRTREYREKHREYGREYSKRRQRKMPEAYAADAAKRRAAKLRRTPAWADADKIRKFYADAKIMSEITGEKWHVDHIVPLRGKKVSGLHVHYNLQILPGTENDRKANIFEPGDA